LRKIGSKLQGHPDMNKVPGIDISSGSLGMGISFGIGTCLGARLNGQSFRTYVVTGCGELDEGQNWEALMCAVKYRLDNLVVIVDYNKVQLDGTNEEIMPLGALERKLAAFNWHVVECDGHDVSELLAALKEARETEGSPTVIVANTVKGKGISFLEHRNEWHGKPINDEDHRKAIAELKGALS
jgi:transketolase